MDRPQVIQALLDRHDKPAYLEIGVSHGLTFHAVHAAEKIAVDPYFQFDLGQAKLGAHAAGAAYHEVTSDEFFAGDYSRPSHFDVIFLDGLHSYDQTLRDLMNAIACLAPGGAIVVDDVLPTSYSASLPTLKESMAFRAATGFVDHAWMGDVYRLIFFIRDYLPAFDYATVADNHGQTILWKAPTRALSSPLSMAAIAGLSFADAIFDKDAFRLTPLAAIVEKIDATRKG